LWSLLHSPFFDKGKPGKVNKIKMKKEDAAALL